jgi:hypothetical protein
MSEKVISAIRKARADFKKTPRGQLQVLFDEQSRWKRKLTIAENKLEAVRRQIDGFVIRQLAECGKAENG